MQELANVLKYMSEFSLTKRQVLFAIYYDGNATRAARQAGYANPESQGSRLYRNVGVQRLLDRLTERQSATTSQGKLLTRADLMLIWSELATDPNATWKDRLKAMDSLAKSQGIFIDRSQVISNVRIESLDKLTDSELYDKLDVLLEELQAGGVTLRLPPPVSSQDD